MLLCQIVNQVYSCHGCVRGLMDRDSKVVNCIWSCVKIKSKLSNLMKISRIEGYNGKYGSNPQEIREISNNLFEFDQIGR